MEENIHTLKRWLESSAHTVILTGAGMSTESGLPDFRSNHGLWHDRDPREIATVEAMYHNREEFIDFYRWRIKELDTHEPHDGYHVMTMLQRQGYVHAILTQNVDGFHHRAQSHRVIELHGTLRHVRCLSCGNVLPSAVYLKEEGHVCPDCSGFLRPDIVLFGEILPEQAWQDAFEETRMAELFCVLGSSLQVSPVNMLPLEAKKSGARLVFINRDPTDFDGQADLLIRENIGTVCARLKQLMITESC